MSLLLRCYFSEVHRDTDVLTGGLAVRPARYPFLALGRWLVAAPQPPTVRQLIAVVVGVLEHEEGAVVVGVIHVLHSHAVRGLLLRGVGAGGRLLTGSPASGRRPNTHRSHYITNPS